MNTRLQEAFEKAACLPLAEQEVLASRLLAELSNDDEFDLAISQSSDRLVILARQALAEFSDGKTQELKPDEL